MNDEIMQSFWVYTIIIIIVFALIWIPLIRLSFRHQKEEKQRQEAKAIEEAKQQEIREKEAREYNKLLEKAKRLGPDFAAELSRLQTEKNRMEANSLVYKGMAGTSRYLASAYRQKSDPYIRGGIASALGGSGLGVYTALKTDEQNRQNDINRQKALNDVTKYSIESKKFSDNAKCSENRHTELINKVEELCALMDKAEELQNILEIEDHFIENSVQKVCSDYIHELTAANTGGKYSSRKGVLDADKKIRQLSTNIDDELSMLEKASGSSDKKVYENLKKALKNQHSL